jgi:eukaryotic-like serine/threonine-protein kinase
MAPLHRQVDAMSDAPQRIGRYCIAGEIGRGAMGVVYRGQDESLGRTVAIKTILTRLSDEEHAGYLARFRQEARALGGLNHPAIITVYEFGDENGLAYLAMEFLDGRELRDVLASERMPVPVALDVAAQVAEGLAFAHSQGIVHRDIKPANIMMLAGSRAKIMDFGIARVRASDVKTQTGLLLGSPKYMSPEQVLGTGIESRSDIFSLGVVLYEMLAGAPPFSGENVHQLMFQVCNSRPSPPSRLNPAVPAVVDLIVAKALEKDPASRYADAGELAADLRRALAQVASSPAAAEIVLEKTQAIERTQVIAPERTQAIRPERTQATAPERTQAIQSIGLHLSRRFDSKAAVKRLAESRGQDRLALSPAGAPQTGVVRLLGDPGLLAAMASIGIALIIAIVIAL